MDFPGNFEKGIEFIEIYSEIEGAKLVLPFNHFGGITHSFYGLPFGGISFIKGIPLIEEVIEIYSKLIQQGKKKGQKSIVVTLAPESYSPKLISLQVKVLLGLGFKVIGESISFHLLPQNNFEEELHTSLRRKLKAFKKEEIEIAKVGFENLEKFMDVSTEIRKRKGIPISIDINLLAQQFQDFPDRYDLYMIEKNGDVIGGGIGIQLSSRVYYKFFPITNPDFDHLSPMVALSSEMQKCARARECRVFDLGIAGPIGGPENMGLATFKSRLGGIPSIKFRFQKSL